MGSDFDKLKYFVFLFDEDTKSEEFFNLFKSDPKVRLTKGLKSIMVLN